MAKTPSAETVSRYPLSWPRGWVRSSTRARAVFRKHETVSAGEPNADGTRGSRTRVRALSVSDAARRLEAELERLGASDPILSTNQKVRLDGTPRSDLSEPADVGAAVYFTLNGKPVCFACDKWDRVADNIAAMAQHIDALRRIGRYGVGRLEQAFAGYTALPPTAEDWAIVLMIAPEATRAEILAAHRQLASIHHPDRGGRAADMAKINEARDRALQTR